MVHPISVEEFRARYRNIRDAFCHLEMRDSYGTEVEIPQIAKWKTGIPDDFSWLNEWCAMISSFRADGKTCRRAKVVSLPLSEYQRWNHSVLRPIVDAGEDIRWVDRRTVAAVPTPPADFYLLDNEAVMFLHFTGSGAANGYSATEEPDVVGLCRSSFETVWNLATPHDEFNPGPG